MKNDKKICVAIVDDHDLFAEAMTLLINRSDAAEVISAYNTIQSCREGLKINGCPDVLLLDIRLPDGISIDFCAELKTDYPDIKVVMLTMFSEIVTVKLSFQNGALGYLLKESNSEEVIKCIETVNNNEKYICQRMLQKINDAGKRADLIDIETIWFTKREKEVLPLIVAGLSDKDIAKKLFIGYHRVREIHQILLQKFGVHNTTQLIDIAKKEGYI
jgi:DNA-binding NarL/FixJ family response regulator